MAWIVNVNLRAVARRMYAQSGKGKDDFDALCYLSAPTHKGQGSPLRQTGELGQFYSEIDPTLLLEPDEILKCAPVAVTKRPELIEDENA